MKTGYKIKFRYAVGSAESQDNRWLPRIVSIKFIVPILDRGRHHTHGKNSVDPSAVEGGRDRPESTGR